MAELKDPAIKLFGRTIQLPDSSGNPQHDSLPDETNGGEEEDDEEEEAHKVLNTKV